MCVCMCLTLFCVSNGNVLHYIIYITLYYSLLSPSSSLSPLYHTILHYITLYFSLLEILREPYGTLLKLLKLLGLNLIKEKVRKRGVEEV